MAEQALNIVITGGHSGMGLALSTRLLEEGHRIGLIVRSQKRIPPELASDRVLFWEADLSNQKDVREVATRITEDLGHVDALFNNAGVLLGDLVQSPQDNEMHFEVNTLAPYLLTLGLKDALLASTRPRVVNTVTGGMNAAKLNLDELLSPKKIRKLVGSYMQSKLALTLLMNRLAADAEWSKAEIRSLNPGAIRTKMTAGNDGGGMPFFVKPLVGLLFSTPEKGADQLHRAAFHQHWRGQTGLYLNGGKSKVVKYPFSEEEQARILSRVR